MSSLFTDTLSQSVNQHVLVSVYLCSPTEHMDQVSIRSGVGSDDVTDETTSQLDSRWSSEEDVRKSLPDVGPVMAHELCSPFAETHLRCFLVIISFTLYFYLLWMESS